MIHLLARCPYCGKGEIAIDDGRPTVVFDPNGPGGAPCPHLAFLSAALDVRADENWQPDAEKHAPPLIDEMSGHWFWVHGEGLHDMPLHGTPDELMDYVDMLACGLLPVEIYPRDLVHEVVGGPDTKLAEIGEFMLPNPTGAPHRAILDGWAIYAPAPPCFVAAVRRDSTKDWGTGQGPRLHLDGSVPSQRHPALGGGHR